MKVVILAGGLGTRLSEETSLKPKPMVEIGGKPILWHIMMIYSEYGLSDFVILGGYKVQIIKEYFLNYAALNSDLTIDLSSGNVSVLRSVRENWRVTVLDTGLTTMTGGRLARSRDVIGNEDFLLTYGDGVGNIDINELLKFHYEKGAVLTLTSAQPNGRFGALQIDNDDRVIQFREKPKGDGSWINAGFMVCSKGFFKYLPDDDTCILEQQPLMECAKDGNLYTYKHRGFWMPMDTLRDKSILNELYQNKKAVWKTW